MARAKKDSNGRVDRLEEAMSAMQLAMANMLQNQSALAQQHTAFLDRMAKIDDQMAETNRLNAERFARIEAILLHHSRILEGLPDAIRDKIGFKSPPS